MTLDIGRRCVYFCVERTRSCSVLCAGTRTRTNTNPNGTEANAAGRSGNARALRKQSKCGMIQEGEGHYAPVPAFTSAPVRICATVAPHLSPLLKVQFRRAGRHSRRTGSSTDNIQLFCSASQLWLFRGVGANRPRY